MTATDIRIRPGVPADLDAIHECFASAFLFDPEIDTADIRRMTFEPERGLVAQDGDQVVGTALALTRNLSIPGGDVATAHVTGVSVRSTHRRRGILRRLMNRQLHEIPEPIAALWASEPEIYGRFGYAPASYNLGMAIDLARVGTIPGAPSGRLREITVEEAGRVLPPVFERYRLARPGVSGRPGNWWRRRLSDPEKHRDGATARHIVVHQDEDGNVDGYLFWRGKSGWQSSGPAGVVEIETLIGATTGAYVDLWRFALGVDLAQTANFRFGSVDEPLRQLVANPRALGQTVRDALWIRIVDVAAALEARSYATSVDQVIEITDALIEANNGRYRLVSDGTRTRCTRTEDAADLSMSVSELAASYLGSRSLAELAFTGAVVEHTPGALAATATALSWPVAPGSHEIF